MQHGMVDLVIVGTDRTATLGDVCNNIGTFLNALAATDNGVPPYIALPSPNIDFRRERGLDIPIEERSPDEASWVNGGDTEARVAWVRVQPDASPAANYALDVMPPARLATGLATEKGAVAMDRNAIAALFPERAAA